MKLLEDLSTFCGKKRPIQISRELTKRYEESMLTTVEKATEHFRINKPKGEFTLILGGNRDVRNENKISTHLIRSISIIFFEYSISVIFKKLISDISLI